jgi:nitrite reductase/ring-hydroxylating ferredoxin subunit
MIEVGQLVRQVGASVERVIEDELDWRHLAFTHASTFSSADLILEDSRGFEADVILTDGTPMRMKVRIDEDQHGYTNSTFFGSQENGRAVCRIRSTGLDSSEMALRFFVPKAFDGDREAAGQFYISLFNRLIDEDEPKMIYRAQALREGPKAHQARRNVTLDDGSTHAIPLVCPHQGLPLDVEPDADGVLQCPWHGFRFDVRTGFCLGGQIRGWRPNHSR